MTQQFLQKNKGFTLIETLVAISIFSMSILGLLSVLSSGIADTNYAKQKVIAGYLAQEGIEYVRNMRDTYILYPSQGLSWAIFENKVSPVCSNDFCGVDISAPVTDANAIAPCSNMNNCKLYISDGNYSVDSGVGNDSGFVRQIQATPIVVGGVTSEIKVISKVSWTQGSGSYNITLSEDLFNWVE
jgi:prepilin-type N-terminal cleavage/methylation domain-containing protein